MKEQAVKFLPRAMSPTDYAYVVLGKPPNQTSISSSLTTGRMDSVDMRIEYREHGEGTLYKTRYQKWVLVPEQERTVNKQYQRNVAAIKSDTTREPWEWILKIDPSTLPDCPKLKKRKTIEKDATDLIPLVGWTLGKMDEENTPEGVEFTFTKTQLIDALINDHTKTNSPPKLSKVVDWYIRRGWIRNTGDKSPTDRRQAVLQLTEEGYLHLIAE